MALQTLILGFDAFDPILFESLLDRGLMPNLAKLVGMRGYSRFAVANPPQSEVSWTSIATGLNPGGHGMFDFVHREPSQICVVPLAVAHGTPVWRHQLRSALQRNHDLRHRGEEGLPRDVALVAGYVPCETGLTGPHPAGIGHARSPRSHGSGLPVYRGS